MRHRRVLSDFYWLSASTKKSANTKGLSKDPYFSLFYFLSLPKPTIDPPHTFAVGLCQITWEQHDFSYQWLAICFFAEVAIGPQ